jgi:hypothetical protein
VKDLEKSSDLNIDWVKRANSDLLTFLLSVLICLLLIVWADRKKFQANCSCC